MRTLPTLLWPQQCFLESAAGHTVVQTPGLPACKCRGAHPLPFYVVGTPFSMSDSAKAGQTNHILFHKHNIPTTALFLTCQGHRDEIVPALREFSGSHKDVGTPGSTNSGHEETPPRSYKGLQIFKRERYQLGFGEIWAS